MGFHLFPFRTEKLSPLAPMVLRGIVGESVAAVFQREFIQLNRLSFLFVYILRRLMSSGALCFCVERIILKVLALFVFLGGD